MISGRPPRRFRPPVGHGEVLRLTTLTVRGRQAGVRLEYFRQVRNGPFPVGRLSCGKFENGFTATVQQTHTLCHFGYSHLAASPAERKFQLTQLVPNFSRCEAKNSSPAKNSSDHLPACGAWTEKAGIVDNRQRTPRGPRNK
jgi:hypothetical protein